MAEIKDGTFDFFVEAVIGNVTIQTGNIMNLIISMDLENKLPVMKIVFTHGAAFQRNGPIQDGCVVDVKYGTTENISKKASFVTRSCSFVQSSAESISYVYTLVGVLNVNDHKAETMVFEKMTSDKVAEQIASASGFKFESNVAGNDEMTWLQASQDSWSFLKDVEEHAFVKEYDSVAIFPDAWKNLTYTTLKTQLDGDEKAVLVTKGMVHNLTEEQKTKFIEVSGYKMLTKSGLINSSAAYGSRITLYDDKDELNIELRDESSVAKNVNRKSDFTKDLSSNLNYGYQPTSVHGYYNYAKAVNEYVRLSLFTDLVEIQMGVTGVKDEQAKALLDLKPTDCVYFLAMLQQEEPDPIIRGKYLIKRADVNYSQNGLLLHLLLGRNGLNLTGEYQGTPATSAEKGEEQATGVKTLGENPTEDLNGKAGPLAGVAESVPDKSKEEVPETPDESKGIPATEIELKAREEDEKGKA